MASRPICSPQCPSWSRRCERGVTRRYPCAGARLHAGVLAWSSRHELPRTRRRHAVRHEGARGARGGVQAARLRRGRARHRAGGARGVRALQRAGRGAARSCRRHRPVVVEGWRGQDHAGLQGRVQAVRRRRLAGAAASVAVRRPGPAQDDRCSLRRDAQQRQPELRAVPAADRWRDRGAADRGHAGPATTVHPEDDRR